MAKCYLGQNKVKEARRMAETSKNHESFKSLPKVNRQRNSSLIEQIDKKEKQVESK